MSGDENRGAEQRIVDGTDVDFENEADRNSVAPEVDRKAFNPRGKLKAARNVGVPVMLAAAGFLGFLSYSIASKQQEEPETIDDFHIRPHGRRGSGSQGTARLHCGVAGRSYAGWH